MSVTFNPNDWDVIDDYPDLVTLLKQRETKGYELGFNIVTNAKLADPVDGHLIPFPDDFVSWIKSNPDFAAGEATEVMVGGVKGIQIDARPTTTKAKDFLHLTSGIIWYAESSISMRFILLNEVNGDRALITFNPPADRFQSAAEEAQKILDGIVFTK